MNKRLKTTGLAPLQLLDDGIVALLGPFSFLGTFRELKKLTLPREEELLHQAIGEVIFIQTFFFFFFKVLLPLKYIMLKAKEHMRHSASLLLFQHCYFKT